MDLIKQSNMIILKMASQSHVSGSDSKVDLLTKSYNH